MICKKIDLKRLPASCSACPYFDETLILRGGVQTGYYYGCSQLSEGCFNSDAASRDDLSVRRTNCPLLELPEIKD